MRILAALLPFLLGLAAAHTPLSLIPKDGALAETTLYHSLFALSYLLAGYPVLLTAGRNILRGQVFDEHFLMTIATAGAIAIGQWAEAAGVMIFYALGEYAQGRAVNRTRRSIRSLMDLRPDYATVLRSGIRRRVSPGEVRPGDTVEIGPGERVPLDGEVITGRSSIDTSAISGESVPRQAAPGSELFSGSVNGEGVLRIRVTRGYPESSAAKIMRLTEEAAACKAPTERFITRFARYYTPAVVLLAAAVALLPPLLAGGGWAAWLYRACVILVVSCPCALVISVPLSFFGGIGASSRSGVLVKGANTLEQLRNIRVLALDKTGTVTRGVFRVKEIVPRGGSEGEQLLCWAAAAESRSNHPIAGSIRGYAAEAGIACLPGEIEEYREYKARGVRAVIGGREVLAGSDRMLHEWEVEHADCGQPETAVYVVVDGTYIGYLLIGDEIKPDSASAIEQLRRAGVERVLMLTGDEQDTAVHAARQAGIDEVHAQLLPEEKYRIIDEIARGKQVGEVAFVGDGVNDAPVLARASVGIAMGGLGSDAAIEAADMVLMNDSLSSLPRAFRIASGTRRIVLQNIVFAVAVKLLFLALGAAGIATMWGAVFADVGVTLLAVFNSLRTLVQPSPLR
jgi:Cd2+/Zn2+-exporting ATPase